MSNPKSLTPAKKGFQNFAQEERAYQQIRVGFMDGYDDPDGEDEDELNRESDLMFEKIYGFKHGTKKYEK